MRKDFNVGLDSLMVGGWRFRNWGYRISSRFSFIGIQRV